MARKPDPAKRENIITAAIATFAQKGYAGTRIVEVAQTAGIGKGTIYEYFRSKEELFFAAFEHLISESEKQISAVAASMEGPASHQLLTVADAVIRDWMEKLDLYGLVLEFWSATTAFPGRKRFRLAFKQGYADFRRQIAALIQAGVSSGEFKADIVPEHIASGLIGSWDALLFQAWLDAEFDPLAASRAHMQIVVDGLQAFIKTEDGHD